MREYKRYLRILRNVNVLLDYPRPILMLTYFCNSILHVLEVLILSTNVVLIIQPFLNIEVFDLPGFFPHKLIIHILFCIFVHTMDRL